MRQMATKWHAIKSPRGRDFVLSHTRTSLITFEISPNKMGKPKRQTRNTTKKLPKEVFKFIRPIPSAEDLKLLKVNKKKSLFSKIICPTCYTENGEVVYKTSCDSCLGNKICENCNEYDLLHCRHCKKTVCADVNDGDCVEKFGIDVNICHYCRDRWCNKCKRLSGFDLRRREDHENNLVCANCNVVYSSYDVYLGYKRDLGY